MAIDTRARVKVPREIRTRLNIYAAAKDIPTQHLVQEIFEDWLRNQPLVGDEQKEAPVN